MTREIEYRQFINGKMIYSGFDGDGSFIMPNVNIDIYPIMQYTGIKDKNGVKIFEDDVVSALIETTPTPEDPCGASALIDGSVVFADGQFTVGDYYLPFNELYNIEVIGNIHEEK